MTLAPLLLVLALILFVLAAAGVASHVDLKAAGLACLTASLLVPVLF